MESLGDDFYLKLLLTTSYTGWRIYRYKHYDCKLYINCFVHYILYCAREPQPDKLQIILLFRFKTYIPGSQLTGNYYSIGNCIDRTYTYTCVK